MRSPRHSCLYMTQTAFCTSFDFNLVFNLFSVAVTSILGFGALSRKEILWFIVSEVTDQVAPCASSLMRAHCWAASWPEHVEERACGETGSQQAGGPVLFLLFNPSPISREENKLWSQENGIHPLGASGTHHLQHCRMETKLPTQGPQGTNNIHAMVNSTDGNIFCTRLGEDVPSIHVLI